MVFTYVTGRGTDSTEQGPQMWARVKGKTENDLLKLPFKAAYMFRPAGIQPLHGVRSKTAWVQAIYVVTAPLLSYCSHRAEIHDHDRATRPRHDQGGPRRLSEAGAGERRYQRDLTASFRGAPAWREPGIHNHDPESITTIMSMDSGLAASRAPE